MESFLDEYQFIRLWLAVAGLVPIIALLLVGNFDDRVVPIGVVLVLVGLHAAWCRANGLRSPRTMLFFDLTLWGWVMTLMTENLAIPTATLGFLTLLIVLFADGYWVALFLAYIGGWYGYAYFLQTQATGKSVGIFFSALMTVGCVAIVVFHVRRWLGRLDANRSQMLGTVSHELRNNLTGMMGVTDLIGLPGAIGDEEMRELMELAHQQAVEATEIVEDLLTISRLEGSALTVDDGPVVVSEEIEAIVGRFASEGTDVDTRGVGTTRVARGDPLRVRQILRNLISNAVRYGGPRISISTADTEDHVVVTVTDDGEGIPVEDAESIFLPYRRSTATRRHASSVGLGLWICRQLASAMGGAIEYEHTGSETRFTLTLRTSNAPPAVGDAALTGDQVSRSLPSPNPSVLSAVRA